MADCVVVGGGVIGLSLAWELSRRSWRVTLLEKHQVGQAASWAGAGILPAANFATALHPFEKLRGLSHALHAQWAQQLHAITGIDNGYRRSGGLYLARTPGETAALLGWRDTLSEEQIDVARLSPAELARDEPALADAVNSGAIRAALRVPDECQVRNPRHVAALREACIQAGVTLREQTEVLSFHSVGERVTSAETTTGRVSGDTWVITTGAWTSLVTRPLRADIAVLPVRGQILLFRCDRPPLRHIINEGSRYLVPRDDGHVLVGATEEEAGFDLSTTAEAAEELRAFAFALVPALREAELLRQWSGLRPASFDGLPYLGRLVPLANAYVAAGHFRSGLHLSPGTAVVLADLLAGITPAVPLSLFRAGR
jgi:glycine oxidase